MEATRKWCTERKIKLADKNFHDLGISAFKETNRPSLADMLEAINTGHIEAGDYIILENLDRLSRQGIDVTQEIINKILRQDVNIISLSDGLELTKKSLNDLVSIIRVATVAYLAHQESEKKRERILQAKTK